MGKGKKKQQAKAKAKAKADAKPRAAETYEDAELTGKAARKSRRSKEKAAAARSEQEVARSWSDVLRVGPYARVVSVAGLRRQWVRPQRK